MPPIGILEQICARQIGLMQDINSLIGQSKTEVNRPLLDARCLDPQFYHDPAIFEAELETIFKKRWLSVCRAEDVPDIGSYLTIDLFGERIIIVRGADQRIRALSGVCRHRWSKLADAGGQTTRFVCPNHAWSYDLDGEMIAAPHMERPQCFKREDYGLHKFGCEVWQGWVFVNFEPGAKSLADICKPIDEQIAPWRIADMRRLMPPIRFEGCYNWKQIAENVGEAYHVIGVHRKTIIKDVDFVNSSWTTDNQYYCRSEFPTATKNEPMFLNARLDIPEGFCGTWSYNLFPCHLFGMTRDFCVWQQLRISSAFSIQMEMHVLAPPNVDPPQEMIEEIRSSIKEVEAEDQEAFDRGFQGLKSAYTKPSPFSKFEEGVWIFQKWLLEQLSA